MLEPNKASNFIANVLKLVSGSVTAQISGYTPGTFTYQDLQP